MNNSKNRFIDYFVKRIFDLYEVTGNQARFLFDRWNILELKNEHDIEKFLMNDKVKKVFHLTPDLNIAKKYTVDELRRIKIELNIIVNQSERIYKDNKYGFTWQEEYSGMSDCYTGLYKIKEPLPNDKHLLEK